MSRRALGRAVLAGLALTSPAWADPCGDSRGACTSHDEAVLEGVRGVYVEFEVADEIDHLWQLIADCMLWPRYIPFFGDCVLIERTGDGARYRSSVVIAGRRQSVVCESTRDTAHHVEHHRVTGDFRSMSAEWRLRAVGPRRTRVTYTIAVDYAWYVPGRTVRAHLQDVLADVVRGVQRWSDERRPAIVELPSRR